MIHIKRIDEMAIKRDMIADYDEIEPFDSEHIKVCKGGLYNIMDNDGNLLSDVWFDKVDKKAGGGFDVEYTDKNNRAHSGQYLDLPELKKNVDISNLVKHTDILDHIDFGDIILIDPYVLKRQGMKRGVKIIANVTYMGESLLLGVDGKLYTQDGNVYEGVQFAISQVDIKRLVKKMDELCSKLNYKFNPKIKDGKKLSGLYESNIFVFAFGFNTNKLDVNYVFNTCRMDTIGKTDTKPWGHKSINSIKVRFVPGIKNELRSVLENKYSYHTERRSDWEIKEWDGLVTEKEYLPTELDEMFAELDEIGRDIDVIYNNEENK